MSVACFVTPHGPRALVEAILTELAHNSWAALAQLAQQLRPAFLAPTDPDAEQEREEHHTILAEARQLASNLGHEEDALPFPALARLHVAIAASTRFAPAERTSVVLNLPGRQLAIERAPTPPPRWALELVMGEHWRRGGLLACALPCPGLIRLDALVERDGDPEEPRILRADALQEWATTMLGHIEASRCEADRIAAAPPGERRTSRAPALFELLRGFGPLRSAQIEAVLTISRLGAKGLLDAIMATGVAARTRIQGVWLYSARAHPSTSGAEDIPGHTFAFSTEALDEYDASIAVIGDLLARTGIDPQRDED